MEQPFDALVGQADEVTDPVRDEVDPVVGPILDVVDDVLGGGDIVEPPGGGGGGDGGGDGGDGPGSNGGGDGRDPRGDDRRLPDLVGDLATAARESGPPTTIEISSDSGIRSVRGGGSGRGLGGFVEEAAPGALLMLVLFGVAIGFVVLQDRVDRGDPKLVLASARADVVRFE